MGWMPIASNLFSFDVTLCCKCLYMAEERNKTHKNFSLDAQSVTAAFKDFFFFTGEVSRSDLLNESSSSLRPLFFLFSGLPIPFSALPHSCSELSPLSLPSLSGASEIWSTTGLLCFLA